MSAKDEGEAVVGEKEGETVKEKSEENNENEDVKDEEGSEEKGEQNDEQNDEVNIEKQQENTNPDEVKEEDDEAQTALLPKSDEPIEQTETSAQTDGKITPDKASEVTSQSKEAASMATASVSEPNLVAPPASQIDLSSSAAEGGTKKPVESHDIKVKFVIMPEGEIINMTCNTKQTILDLRKHLSSEVGQPADIILMMHEDKLLDDTGLLSDLGAQLGQTLQIELQSSDPINNPLRVKPAAKTPTKLPPVINVKAESNGKPVEIKVHIVQEDRKKPFIGGYKHRLTGTEYHNATAQTVPKIRVPSPVECFHRDTQTYKMRNRLQQTTNTTSTQMTKDGCYVSNITDKVVIPGKYETAEDYHNKRLEKVIILQTYWRRWLAIKYVQNLKRDQHIRQEWERQEEIRKQKEKAERIRKEWDRRLNPKTKEDFDLLYAHLEKWRLEEIERIEQLYSGPERKAALIGLVEQEAYLIASIDRHKIAASNENMDKKVKSFLDKAAAPKRWRAFDGKITEMDTPYTIRAQELRDIYNTLCMKYLTQDERLDVLLTLKHTVKEHDCKLTHEIVELIDREADLLMRGVKENNLEGLRKRISTLFLQYCKTPLFNPEAARLIKVPQDPTVLRKNIYFCPSCNRYLPSTEFKLSLTSSVVGRCRKCIKLDNDARLRQDLLQYKNMLRGLRRVEEDFEDGSQIAYLIQEPDLRYLVENIWNSQSALSAHDDLFDLVLVRWNKHEEWSPWNCILLTKEEAKAHSKLDNVTEAYGRMFIGKILHKHLLARNYFSRLPGMAERMKSKISPQSAGATKGPQTVY
ncbi:IQ and ubiquitin-like domain-containing protein [Actinia tenebrosa]|uniref:IQ and ubiquitin-like domain-containing protein n=1 Tax=Actinia tenebrosa TaxID=6105 RepID=A0A6P8H360_ACTTE|nr:IQ and ubiquitin-like domain-containing protein [Actinia tenebrosa]